MARSRGPTTWETSMESSRSRACWMASSGVLPSSSTCRRRLLSLDFVLEHPGMNWLPTEPEKVEFWKGSAYRGG